MNWRPGTACQCQDGSKAGERWEKCLEREGEGFVFRLTNSHLSGRGAELYAFAGIESTSYAYDALGNPTHRSDAGSYTYTYTYGNGAGPGPGSAGVHAVTAIAGLINTAFAYDANGNQVSGNGRSITWSSYNKPLELHASGATRSRHHITAAGQTVAVINETAAGDPCPRPIRPAVRQRPVGWGEPANPNGRTPDSRSCWGSFLTPTYRVERGCSAPGTFTLSRRPVPPARYAPPYARDA